MLPVASLKLPVASLKLPVVSLKLPAVCSVRRQKPSTSTGQTAGHHMGVGSMLTPSQSRNTEPRAELSCLSQLWQVSYNRNGAPVVVQAIVGPEFFQVS